MPVKTVRDRKYEGSIKYDSRSRIERDYDDLKIKTAVQAEEQYYSLASDGFPAEG